MVGIADILKIGNIGGLLSPAGVKTPSTPSRPGFKSSVGVTDGDAAFNTQAEVLALVGAAGVVSRIWEQTVPAQQQVRWGYGTPALPDNQGKMWFAIADAGTDIGVGRLRLIQENNRRITTLTIAEMNDAQLHTQTNTSIATLTLIDAQQMIRLPEQVVWPRVGEDSRIGLSYILITAATTADVCGFDIPVTIYQ